MLGEDCENCNECCFCFNFVFWVVVFFCVCLMKWVSFNSFVVGLILIV